MKKILAISSVLLGTVFLTGCGQQPVSQTQPTTPASVANQQAPQQNNRTKIAEQDGYFINNELGIKFAYSSDEYKEKLEIQGNKIIYKYPDTDDIQYIELFTKKDTQMIEEAILEIVKNNGKDIKNCKVVNNGEYRENPKYNEYVLDLANPEIYYSKQELNDIKLADVEAKKDGGPFNGEWKKQEIYNKRLVENCSEYADKFGLGTSKTVSSQFIYNNKNRFVFLPGLSGPSFYQEDSIELFD